MKILYGKKTVMFPFVPKVDLDHFIELHQADKNGYMCQFCLKELNKNQSVTYIMNQVLNRDLFIWTVMTKGKDAKRAGFIYLNGITEFSGSVNGIMDTEFVKSIDKQMRRGKYTFAQDALTTMIDACFNDFNFLRIESDLSAHNKLAMALNKRIGFVQEGVKRRAYKVDDKYYDVILMSILKEEWNKNGEKFSTINSDTAVSSAG